MIETTLRHYTGSSHGLQTWHFSESEMTLIEQALGIAADQFSANAETCAQYGQDLGVQSLVEQFRRQNEAARELRLRLGRRVESRRRYPVSVLDALDSGPALHA